MFEKIKYKIVFVQLEFSNLSIIKIVNLKKIVSIYTNSGKTYNIDIEKPTIIDKLTRIYYLNSENGSQLYFNEIKAILNPTELDEVINNKMLHDLLNSTLDMKDKIINLIIGAVMGAMVTGFLAMLYMNSKLEEIYSQFITITP